MENLAKWQSSRGVQGWLYRPVQTEELPVSPGILQA